MRIDSNSRMDASSGPQRTGDGGAFDSLAERLDAETGSSKSETRYYLELQRKIQKESRFFQTVSNVLKARHDSSMAAIRNLK